MRIIKSISFLSFILSISTLILSCSSSTSDKADDLTPPPVPSGLEITQIGNGAVTLEWDKVPDSSLKGYLVYWLGDSEVEVSNANMIFVSSSSATIENLDYETQYYFAVSSVDESENESALSTQERGKPLNDMPPGAPKGLDLVAENINFPQISIYWSENDEPDIAYYNLYRAKEVSALKDSATSFLARLTVENYVDIDVEVGEEYYYSVSAVDKGGWESTASSSVSDYILSKVELLFPLNFAYTGKSPSFKWQAVTGAAKYNLVLTNSRIGGEIWNVEIDNSTSEIIYNGKTALINGNTYYWKVGSISRKEINSVSEVGTFVVKQQ